MSFGEIGYLYVKSGGVYIRTCSSEGYYHGVFVTPQGVG